MKRKAGFTMIEVIVGLAIALVMLTALLSLDIKSTRIAAETTLGIDALPVAIEEIEEWTKQTPTGKETKQVEDYTVVTETVDTATGVDLTRTKVEVFYDDKPCTDLSLYKFH